MLGSTIQTQSWEIEWSEKNKWRYSTLIKWSDALERAATAQKMKLSINDFFSKCDQIRSYLRIWSHLLKKLLIENFIFNAVMDETALSLSQGVLEMLEKYKKEPYVFFIKVIQIFLKGQHESTRIAPDLSFSKAAWNRKREL